MRVLQDLARALLDAQPEAGHWTLTLEYELSRERGRRPDAVLLAGPFVIVLEFKDTATPQQAHIDQAAAYARDMSAYHAASHGRHCAATVVLTGARNLATDWDGVWVASPDRLTQVILDLLPVDTGAALDPEGWLASPYAPLPTLVAAARSISQREPWPFIRRGHSAGIPIRLQNCTRLPHRPHEQ